MLIIGDSITHDILSYFKSIAKNVNEIHSNDEFDPTKDFTSADLLSKIYDLQESGKKIEMLVLSCGTDDLKTDELTGKKRVRLKLYGRNVETVIEEATKLADKIFWINIAPVRNEEGDESDNYKRFNEDVHVYNNMAAQIMSDNNVPIIDLNDFTQSLGDNIYANSYQFNEDTKKKQAEFIFNSLNSALADF